MAKFASAAKQAASVMKVLQRSHIKSVGTVRNYEQALTRVCEYLKQNRSVSLREITPVMAIRYLEQRGQEVRQSTLNMERQALQAMMYHVTHKLEPGTKLTVIKSELDQALASRSYTPIQVSMICNSQNDRNSLATRVAYEGGLRAHELLTLRRAEDAPADPREANAEKFSLRDGVRYTVEGKGGLRREVQLSHELSRALEQTRLIEPRAIDDRGIIYQQHYDIAGGQRWSNSFSAASKRALGWSSGAHGLRHSYAQERMDELQSAKLEYVVALETVSQELGHFRPYITEVYLR